MLTIKPIFFLKNVFIFNWRIIALQYCVGFCHPWTWINHRYTYIPTLLNLPITSHPIPPLYVVMEHRFEHSASYRKFSLAICFTYGNVYVSILLSQLSPPLLSPLCPQVYSLHLHHCPANSVIRTFSLDSTCMRAKLHQLCMILCNTMDCSPPGSSVHGILQARILEWVAMPSQGIFLTQGLNLRLLQFLHC